MLENEMIKIPEGKIILNDDRKKEKWEVKINSFLLNKFPVTQELYHSITNLNPSTFKGKFKPVETVSWKDAITFCNLLSQKKGLNSCYILMKII